MNLGQLLKYIRSRTKTENNPAISDDALLRMTNLSLGALDETLCTEYEDYHLKTYLATLGGVSNLIPIPPDFFKLRGVDFGSPGQWITIYGFGLQQRNYFNSPYSNMYANYGNQVQRKVRMADTSILIEPLNLCSGQYQIWYTPKFMPFDADDLSANLPYDMDTESFIEYAVAATGSKIYSALNLPTESFDAQMIYYEDKVRNSAKNRMSMGPQTMINVRNRGNGWRGNRRGFGI